MAHTIPTNGGTAVGFYRGTQENLNKLNEYKNGAFYITTDTDRLYYAQEDGLVYLNKSIQTVPTQSQLPTGNNVLKNEFYYVTDGNILCYWNDSDNSWIQINYHLETDTSVQSIEIKKQALSDKNSDGNTDIPYKLTLHQQDKDGVLLEGKDIVAEFFISGKDIGDIVVNDLEATVKSNEATVTLKKGVSGSNALDGSDKFTIVGSGATTIKGETDKIIIESVDTDTTYNLKVTDDGSSEPDAPTEHNGIATVSLNGSDNDNSAVHFAAGKSITINIDDDNNFINIGHEVFDGDNKNASVTTGQLEHEQEVTIVQGVKVNNGHVTGINTTTVTMPSVTPILEKIDNLEDSDITGVSADDKGQIILEKAGNDNIVSGSDLYYKINDDKYYNQADLTVPLKTFIGDELSKVTNAMVFKGAITSSELPSIASIGDTYIINYSEGIVIPNGEGLAKVGDILIAYSSDNTENNEGTIDSAKLRWTLIPGTEFDTTYTFSANDNQIVLKNNADNSTQNIEITDDDIVILTTKDNKLSGAHKAIPLTPTDGPATSLTWGKTFNTLTNVNGDGYGHVDKKETTAFTMPNAPIHYLDADVSGKKAVLKDYDNSAQGSIKVAGSNKISIAFTPTTGADGKDDIVFTAAHETTVRDDNNPATSTAEELGDGTVFTVVTGVSSDNYGHITGVTTQPYKAIDTTYELSGNVTQEAKDLNKKVTITDVLTDSNNNTTSSIFSLTSTNENLTIAKSDNVNNINVGLVWGTF